MRCGKSRCSRALLLSVVLSAVVSAYAQGQAHVYPPKKPEPAEMLPRIFVIGDHVVEEQWPASLGLVNGPADLEQVEPGQCIRFGVVASGDGRDGLLNSAKFAFEFTLAGKTQTFPAESAQAMKHVKPEGGDFVAQALKAAGVQNPMPSLVSMAASHGNWCAPADTQEGTARVRGTATLTTGESVSLQERTIEVKTLESARKQAAFTDMLTFSTWLQRYHVAPDPAHLLPGLRLVAADEKLRVMFNVMTFFVAALKDSPVAAEEILHRLPGENPQTIIYAIPVLRHAGYPTESLVDGLPEERRAILHSVELPDPFDIQPDSLLFYKMDMLWATFFATGRDEPVKLIVSMLAWREDYERFAQVRASGEKPTELTESMARGLAYAAAGWSLNALSRDDQLLRDYIDVIEASPDTPSAVKAELANLYTNPAFNRIK
jgi:hypothetical protein